MIGLQAKLIAALVLLAALAGDYLYIHSLQSDVVAARSQRDAEKLRADQNAENYQALTKSVEAQNENIRAAHDAFVTAQANYLSAKAVAEKISGDADNRIGALDRQLSEYKKGGADSECAAVFKMIDGVSDEN